jgi:hypothetical protein
MKKIIFISLLLCAAYSYSQNESNKKIQLGLSYSLTKKDFIYNNPLSVYANYQLKKWDKLGVNAGIGVFYYISKESKNFTNKFGFNPNVSVSYDLIENKLLSYVAAGYYYDSYVFKPSLIALYTSPSRDYKTSGVTITPGLKYFVHPNIFIDANASLLFANTKDELAGSSESSDKTLFSIGLGVAF